MMRLGWGGGGWEIRILTLDGADVEHKKAKWDQCTMLLLSSIQDQLKWLRALVDILSSQYLWLTRLQHWTLDQSLSKCYRRLPQTKTTQTAPVDAREDWPERGYINHKGRQGFCQTRDLFEKSDIHTAIMRMYFLFLILNWSSSRLLTKPDQRSFSPIFWSKSRSCWMRVLLWPTPSGWCILYYTVGRFAAL